MAVMSASDAAPLPRLGEVFFDVRGDSRSMRLSWYADTDVAVFSIWQGGVCTGTFRLPMADLARMVDILQRGPQRRSRSGARASRRQAERPADGGPGYDEPDYGEADGEADYADGEYGEPDYAGGEYNEDGYAEPGYRDPGYQEPEPGMPGFGEARTGGYPAGPSAYPPPDDRTAAYQAGDYRLGGGREPVEPGQRYGLDDPAGYAAPRFVPPYVRGQDESYPNDNPVVRAGHRRGPAEGLYPADRQTDSPLAERYREASLGDTGYFDDPDYRLPADPGRRTGHSAGRHSHC